ncbi:MAG: putative zinc-binding peptidase [Pseudomonadota bacterium]
MKLFECAHCGQLLYFHNTKCERCGYRLGYRSDVADLSALVLDDHGAHRPYDASGGPVYRSCGNAESAACNWLVPLDDTHSLCRACRLNRTIPNLDNPVHRLHWQRLEAAKRRLVYALCRLDLPLMSKMEHPSEGLAFDFLAETEEAEGPTVLTGHAGGLITISVAEADDAEREKRRLAMGEPYRTILGHFRHEVGHYYWLRLVNTEPWLPGFRTCFGDERTDYGVALSRHYEDGPLPAWQENFVSAYAAAHPWEDFAETFAHYLHIVDTLETAFAFGLVVQPRAGRDPALAASVGFNPYRENDFDRIIDAWLPLTYAVNSLNQSMGQPDLYPFVLAPPVVEKLRFVHRLIRASVSGAQHPHEPIVVGLGGRSVAS